MTADVLGQQSEHNILEHDVAVDMDVVKRGEWKHIHVVSHSAIIITLMSMITVETIQELCYRDIRLNSDFDCDLLALSNNKIITMINNIIIASNYKLNSRLYVLSQIFPPHKTA